MLTTTPPTAVRFTRAQFYEIIGLLDPDRHYELLDGTIYIKRRSNPPHSGTVTYFLNRLRVGLGDAYQLQSQEGLEVLPDDAPEPDVSVLHAIPDYYSTRYVTGDDVALVIEVGDTERNGQDKMRFYMRDGRIPLAWRIDIPARCVELWTPADTENPYEIYRDDDHFGFEDVMFAVNEIPALKPLA